MANIDREERVFDANLRVKETSAPATPASGYVSVYATSNGLNRKDDTGDDTPIAEIEQTGTGTGRRIFVQLSGESAPSGAVKGDILIAEV